MLLETAKAKLSRLGNKIAMKYFILLLSVQLCLYGCANYLPYSSLNESDKTVLVRVECRNSKQVESAVMQVLHLVHINDLEKQSDETSLIIKARYQALTDFEAVRFDDELQRMPGVLDVKFIKDGVPVKNVH
jgi:hypothetical protein